MDVSIEKIETLDALKELIRELRVENGSNDDEIAKELDRRRVAPRGWSAYRVQCIVRAFKVYRKWGRKTAAEEAQRFLAKQHESSSDVSKRHRKRRKLRVVGFDDRSVDSDAEAV